MTTEDKPLSLYFSVQKRYQAENERKAIQNRIRRLQLQQSHESLIFQNIKNQSQTLENIRKQKEEFSMIKTEVKKKYESKIDELKSMVIQSKTSRQSQLDEVKNKLQKDRRQQCSLIRNQSVQFDDYIKKDREQQRIENMNKAQRVQNILSDTKLNIQKFQKEKVEKCVNEADQEIQENIRYQTKEQKQISQLEALEMDLLKKLEATSKVQQEFKREHFKLVGKIIKKE